MKAIGGEEDCVSGRKLDDVLIVKGGRKKAGGKAAFSERLALNRGGVKGKRKSRIGKSQSVVKRIEDCVQRGAKTVGQGTLEQALV